MEFLVSVLSSSEFSGLEGNILVAVARHGEFGHWGCGDSVGGGGSCGRCCGAVVLVHFPAADAGVPPAVILAALDIEAEIDCLTYADGVLLGSFAEKVEMNFLG